jgi:signal transduction histidine kinase
MWLGNLKSSTTFRISAAFVAIFSLGVLAFGGFLYWATAGYMERETNAVIEAEIEALADIYRRGGAGGLISIIKERVERDPGRSSLYLLTDQRGYSLVGNLDGWPAVRPNESGWVEFPLRDARTQTISTARVRPFRLAGGFNLLVGRDIGPLIATAKLIRQALMIGVSLTMVVGIGAATFVSVRILRRLESINRTSRRVIDGDLDQRVPVLGRHDDLDQLGANLNEMLDEIQSLMTGIQQVTDNVAHDLRTPLTRIRNRLERMREGTEGAGSAGEIVACIAEVDRLMSTFDALLRITRLESGADRAKFERVDLMTLVADATELYEPFAGEHGTRLNVTLRPACTDGDRELLFQAVCNVIDNAVKFCPGGAIDIFVGVVDERPIVVVADDGPGLPSEEFDRVFERFYRGERARSSPGSGLGLSLVKAAADFHGATVKLAHNHPGLRVLIEFPSGSDESQAAA